MYDPIIVDSALTSALKAYVREGVDDVSCLVAKFFNAFVNDSPLVESYEVDNFILRNGAALCSWYAHTLLHSNKMLKECIALGSSTVLK